MWTDDGVQNLIRLRDAVQVSRRQRGREPLCYNGVMAHNTKEHCDASNAAALCMVGLENIGNILLGLPVAAIIFTCLIPPIGGILFLIWLFLLFCIAGGVISCIFEDTFKSKSKSKPDRKS